MVKTCPNCKKEVKWYQGFSDTLDKSGRYCSFKCFKEHKKKKREKEKTPAGNIKEYKRKCNQCGKVWHSLASREKEIEKKIRSGTCDELTATCGMCGGNWSALGASTQAKRNRAANESDLERLKKCPKCGSSDYKEEVVTYAKK